MCTRQAPLTPSGHSHPCPAPPRSLPPRSVLSHLSAPCHPMQVLPLRGLELRGVPPAGPHGGRDRRLLRGATPRLPRLPGLGPHSLHHPLGRQPSDGYAPPPTPSSIAQIAHRHSVPTLRPPSAHVIHDSHTVGPIRYPNTCCGHFVHLPWPATFFFAPARKCFCTYQHLPDTRFRIQELRCVHARVCVRVRLCARVCVCTPWHVSFASSWSPPGCSSLNLTGTHSADPDLMQVLRTFQSRAQIVTRNRHCPSLSVPPARHPWSPPTPTPIPIPRCPARNTFPPLVVAFACFWWSWPLRHILAPSKPAAIPLAVQSENTATQNRCERAQTATAMLGILEATLSGHVFGFFHFHRGRTFSTACVLRSGRSGPSDRPRFYPFSPLCSDTPP